MWGKGVSARLVRMDQFIYNLGMFLCNSAGAKKLMNYVIHMIEQQVVMGEWEGLTAAVKLYTAHACHKWWVECRRASKGRANKLINVGNSRHIFVVSPDNESF